MCQICINYLKLSDFNNCFQELYPIDNNEIGYGKTIEKSSDLKARAPRETNAHSSKGTGRLLFSWDHYSLNESFNNFVNEALKNYAFLDYSALNWAHHYRQQSQQYRANVHTDAELLCDPDRIDFVYWASVTTFRCMSDYLSGCDRLGVASRLGLVDVVEKFSSQVKDIDAKQRIYARLDMKNALFMMLIEKTALMIAIEQRHLDVIRILIERGAKCSLRVQNRNSPFSEALVYYFRFVRSADRSVLLDLLLCNGVDINSKVIHTQTALHYACCYSHTRLVRFLVENGADLEAPTGDSNWTALQEIILTGNERMAAILVDHGADFRVHTNNKHGEFREAGEFVNDVM